MMIKRFKISLLIIFLLLTTIRINSFGQRNIRMVKSTCSLPIVGKYGASGYEVDGDQERKLISAIESDVVKYYKLWDIYDSDLKKKKYSQTEDYKNKLIELNELKNILTNGKVYLDFQPSYYERNNGIKYELKTESFSVRNESNGNSFYGDPEILQIDEFIFKLPEGMAVETYSREGNNGTIYINQFTSFKIKDEDVAWKVEENGKNVRLLFVFNVSDIIPYKEGYWGFDAHFYQTNLFNVFVYNDRTGEIYAKYGSHEFDQFEVNYANAEVEKRERQKKEEEERVSKMLEFDAHAKEVRSRKTYTLETEDPAQYKVALKKQIEKLRDAITAEYPKNAKMLSELPSFQEISKNKRQDFARFQQAYTYEYNTPNGGIHKTFVIYDKDGTNVNSTLVETVIKRPIILVEGVEVYPEFKTPPLNVDYIRGSMEAKVKKGKIKFYNDLPPAPYADRLKEYLQRQPIGKYTVQYELGIVEDVPIENFIMLMEANSDEDQYGKNRTKSSLMVLGGLIGTYLIVEIFNND